jgi:hypothetical protein
MNAIELFKEMEMAYEEFVEYLQQKYGLPKRAYFCTKTCKSKAKIGRGNEGLFIHHAREDVIDDLSKPDRAIAYPWEYQEPMNLCYCNYLEHLWLHILINQKRCRDNGCFVSDGILHYLVPNINTIYFENIKYTDEWRNIAKDVIIENKEEYILMLNKWLNMIDDYNEFYWLTLENLINGSASEAGTLYSMLMRRQEI